MKRLNYLRKLNSWNKTMPLMPIYHTENQEDISLAAICGSKEKLVLNINSATGFDDIEMKYHEINPDYKYLTKVLPKEDRPLKYFAEKLVKAVENYFIQLWDKDKFHLIMCSAGMDSRIISYVLSKLRDKIELGKLHFRCHEPEGDLFKEVMKEQGWDEKQYSVYKENKLSEADYYVRKFSQNANGFSRPGIEFWDDIITDKDNTVYVGGLCGGELFSYPLYPKRAFSDNRYEDIIANTGAIFNGLARLYNGWNEILLPFASYEYLDIAFRISKQYFKWSEGEQKRDSIRLEMCKILGNKLPFFIGHTYNLKMSEEAAKLMQVSYRTSKFYQDFPEHIVKSAFPWIFYQHNNMQAVSWNHIDLKLYGLATMYQNI